MLLGPIVELGVSMFSVDRFQLAMRSSCPYPYADSDDHVVMPCTVGSLRSVLNGLVYTAHVGNLTPYTTYEFQLSVMNQYGSAEQPSTVLGTTLQAGDDDDSNIINNKCSYYTRS